MSAVLTRRSLLTRSLALVSVLVGTVALTPACAGAHRYDIVTLSGPPRGEPASLAVAPAVLLDAGQIDLAPDGAVYRSRPFTPEQEHGPPLPPPTPQQKALLNVFYANLFVGKIWHGGGYELLPEVGNQVRSLGISLSLQRPYAEQAQQWTDDTIAAVLTERGASWTPVGSSIEAALAPPRRTSVRGTQALDGEDNQNLPNFTLIPTALDPAALPKGITADQILVPIIVHYFAHNGGWFLGQADGCPAGARFRILWVLYDVASGRVVTWGDISTRYVEPYFYTPNDVQLQDYLIQAETRMRSALSKSLLR
ncbi:MAG: hypothetical protein GXP62_09935 [Oligoflexia bacterium]|nr:hypothetical protein [Oligoflexia bacterium]